MNAFEIRAVFAVAAMALLASCGGGASSGPTAGSNDPVQTLPFAQLSGSVVKGPVSGSKVCVYELVPAGKGRVIACTVSNSDGSYALNVPFEGDVIVEASGGAYTDEASGTPGVQLGAPLMSAARLGNGPNTLHATPLTTLAVGQALGAGAFNLAGFKEKAALVRDAFGLPVDAELGTTMPDVRPGFTNAYGEVLRGISKMLGMGATLSGLVENTDLDAIKKAYAQARLCLPANSVPAKAAAAAVAPSGEIRIEAGGVSVDGTIFTVTNPDPAWRALLAESATPMGCTVTTNTADLVVLNCPQSALQGNLTLTVGSAVVQAPVPVTLTEGNLLAMGGSVQVAGGLTVGGNLSMSSNTFINGGVVQLGQSGVLSLSVTADTLELGQVTVQNSVTISTGGSVPPTICISGGCQACPTSLNGGQCGGGIPGWPQPGVFTITSGGQACGSSALSTKGVLAN